MEKKVEKKKTFGQRIWVKRLEEMVRYVFQMNF